MYPRRSSAEEGKLIQARVDCLRNCMRSALEVHGTEEAWADLSFRKLIPVSSSEAEIEGQDLEAEITMRALVK